jgi:hypothetical protein
VGLKYYQSLRISLGLWRWHYFEFLFRRRFVLNIFPFLVSTAKLLGDFYNNRLSTAKIVIRASPILLFSLYCANTIGAAIRTPLIGEAQRTKKNPRKLHIGTTNSPCFEVRRAFPRFAS